MRAHGSFGPGRAALALGILGLVAPAFALTTSSNNNFVLVQGPALVAFPVVGLIAVAGALTRRRLVVAVAGAAYAAAALVQLVQLGLDTNWLAGNGSTFSLLLALAVGLVISAALPDDAATDRQYPDTQEDRPWT